MAKATRKSKAPSLKKGTRKPPRRASATGPEARIIRDCIVYSQLVVGADVAHRIDRTPDSEHASALSQGHAARARAILRRIPVHSENAPNLMRAYAGVARLILRDLRSGMAIDPTDCQFLTSFVDEADVYLSEAQDADRKAAA